MSEHGLPTAPTVTAAWEMLCIAPTDDVREIRRGYARILKTIDVQREPWRFAALRDAYDLVLSQPNPPNVAALDTSDVAPSERFDGADRQRIRACAVRIEILLAGDQPIGEIEDELADLTLQMLAEIERDTVDRQCDSEDWIASTIAAHVPRSDAIIFPAVASFNWQSRTHEHRRPAQMSVALDRMRDLSFARSLVVNTNGRHHLAWLTLQTAPPKRVFKEADLAALASLPPFFREVGYMPVVAGITFDPDIVMNWHDALRKNTLALDRWRAKGSRTGRAKRLMTAMWVFFALAMIAILAL